MGNVQEFIAVEKIQRNLCKPSWLTTNMIVAYALPVIKKAIPSTYREAEINSESMIWKDARMKEMCSLYKITLGDCQSCLRERSRLVVNGYL